MTVRTAIVWKNFQQAYVLKGHEAAVWSVLSADEEVVLTGERRKTLTDVNENFI